MVTAFTFPQAGERVNAAAVPVPEPVLVNLLVIAYIGHYREGCQIEGCHDCANNLASIVAAHRLLTPQLSELVDRYVVGQVGSHGQEQE